MSDELPMMPDPRFPRQPEPPRPAPPPTDAPPAATRQTLNYLRGLLGNYGLEPKHKLGQNFLIDLNLLDLVAKAAELSPQDSVLEVGTGTGSLTGRLAHQAGGVFTVEIDASIQKIARQLLASRPNVRLFLGDALARKNLLNPDMLAGWHRWTTQHGLTTLKLVANLPYVIATPLITNLLIDGPPLERMVVMVQWEIAQRMQAQPGSKDFNSLSVLVQSLADVSVVRKVGPTNFFPKPKVDSAIVMIRPNAAKRAEVGDVRVYRAFLRDLYVHRRKNLRGALAGLVGQSLAKAEIDQRLEQLGLDGQQRSEVLSLQSHLALARAFAAALPPTSLDGGEPSEDSADPADGTTS